MRCDTVFADAVHLKGTDLDFQRLSVSKGDRGVQGLVHVGLRHGHIILETARDGAPQSVHDSQRAVAILYRVHQYADSQQIINFIQFFMIPHHLFIDAVKVLGTTLNLALDINPVEFLAQSLHGIVDHGFPFFSFRLDLLYQIVVKFRILISEGHVFQFPFYGINTQPVGKGRINLQRLLGNRMLFVHRHIFHGAHIMQTVRQFDDNHPYILGHGQEHFAVIFNLPFLF